MSTPTRREIELNREACQQVHRYIYPDEPKEKGQERVGAQSSQDSPGESGLAVEPGQSSRELRQVKQWSRRRDNESQRSVGGGRSEEDSAEMPVV